MYNEHKKEAKEEFYLSSWYGGDTRDLESNKPKKKSYRTCGVVEGCTGEVTVDAMNENVCSLGHSQERPETEDQYFRESQV